MELLLPGSLEINANLQGFPPFSSVAEKDVPKFDWAASLLLCLGSFLLFLLPHLEARLLTSPLALGECFMTFFARKCLHRLRAFEGAWIRHRHHRGPLNRRLRKVRPVSIRAGVPTKVLTAVWRCASLETEAIGRPVVRARGFARARLPSVFQLTRISVFSPDSDSRISQNPQEIDSTTSRIRIRL
jgi:hypothetical protein